MDGKHTSHGVATAFVEPADQIGAGVGVSERGVVVLVERGPSRLAGGEPGLGPDVVDRVLVGVDDDVAGDAEGVGETVGEAAGIDRLTVAGDPRVGQPGAVGPQRLAVPPPADGDLPSGERFARIPLALAVLNEPAGGEPVGEALGEVLGEGTLGRTVGGGVPLGAFHVVDRHERRLPAHRQPDVAGLEPLVDCGSEGVDPLPLHVVIGQRDPGVLPDPPHRVGVFEGHLGRGGGTRHRSGGRGVGCGSERDVALGGEQPRGRVEADPPGTRHVDLGPGVEVGEVRFRSVGPVERRLVGGELDQVAGHEPGGEPEPAERLDKQPSRVAT